MITSIKEMLSYLYFFFYRYAKNTQQSRDMPHGVASIYFAVVLGINCLIFLLLLSKLNVFSFPRNISRMHSYLLIIPFILLSTYYFSLKKNGVALVAMYLNINKEEIKKKDKWVYLYLIISFLSIFAVGLFKPGYLGG